MNDVANDLYQPTECIEPSTTQDDETNQTDKQEETKQNINSSENNESISEQDQPTKIIEEQISSSDQNQLEKDSEIGYISSTGYYGTINDSSHIIYRELSQQSLTDVEQDNIDLIEGKFNKNSFFYRSHLFFIIEVSSTSSPKFEEKEFNDNNESNLQSVLQGL